MLYDKYQFDFFPENNDFRESLNNIGFNYEIDNYYSKTQDKNNIFTTIKLDLIDALQSEYENNTLDLYETNDSEESMTLIEVACKYGSEKCFSYLKLIGCPFSPRTFKYAIEGGNKNIVMYFINEGVTITDEHIKLALKCSYNDLFMFLFELKGSIQDINLAEIFYYGNFKAFLFLFVNGFEHKKIYTVHINEI